MCMRPSCPGRRRFPRSAACDELVLWFEHDLLNQLNLVQLLERHPILSREGADRQPGLHRGVSRPARLQGARRIGAGRHRLAAGDAARGERCAVRACPPCSGTPSARRRPRRSRRLLGEDLDALPFLAAAFRRHLEEFPSTRDGLSRTERRVLEIGSSSPIDVGRAFSQLHDGETAFFIADASFLDVARHLAALTPALLTFDGHVLQTTADGMAVLDKAADRVALCGINRWLGGVRLEGRGPVWRWDAAGGQDRARVARPAGLRSFWRRAGRFPTGLAPGPKGPGLR